MGVAQSHPSPAASRAASPAKAPPPRPKSPTKAPANHPIPPEELPMTGKCSNCKQTWAVLFENVSLPPDEYPSSYHRQMKIGELVAKHTFEECPERKPRHPKGRSAYVWEHADGTTTNDWSRGSIEEADKAEQEAGDADDERPRKLRRSARTAKKAADEAEAVAVEPAKEDTAAQSMHDKALDWEVFVGPDEADEMPIKSDWGPWLAKG